MPGQTLLVFSLSQDMKNNLKTISLRIAIRNARKIELREGKSDEHNAAMRSKYGDWWANEQNKETEDNEYE